MTIFFKVKALLASTRAPRRSEIPPKLPSESIRDGSRSKCNPRKYSALSTKWPSTLVALTGLLWFERCRYTFPSWLTSLNGNSQSEYVVVAQKLIWIRHLHMICNSIHTVPRKWAHTTRICMNPSICSCPRCLGSCRLGNLLWDGTSGFLSSEYADSYCPSKALDPCVQ